MNLDTLIDRALHRALMGKNARIYCLSDKEAGEINERLHKLRAQLSGGQLLHISEPRIVIGWLRTHDDHEYTGKFWEIRVTSEPDEVFFACEGEAETAEVTYRTEI